jgi:putative heme transporter
VTSAAADPGEHIVGDAVRRTKRSAWLTRLGLLLLAALVTVAVVQLVGRIDWSAVWEALLHLTWWQPVVLLAVVVVRQVLNALPLAFYIPGVSVLRATVNDLGAILMSAVAPPPSDLALRVGMFNSWGVPTAKGLAGTVMNTLTFYIVRFSAPTVGFLLLAIVEEPPGLRLLDIVFVGVALTLLVGVLLVVPSEQLATRVGTRAARIARRVRRQIDPDAWVRACVDFGTRSPPGSATASYARCSACSGCSPPI